jgi:hypothetical protein
LGLLPDINKLPLQRIAMTLTHLPITVTRLATSML